MSSAIRVTVWNEYRHEREEERFARVYPDGIHGAIAAGLREHEDFVVRMGTLDEPDHGLTEAAMNETDDQLWLCYMYQW